MRTVISAWAFSWTDVRNLLPEGNGLCLDLGCGHGSHRALVEGAGWTWVGLDVDVRRGGAMILGDALRLPLASESFDLVLLWQVLEHLSHPWTAMSEVNRVLKPGGQVYGSVSCLEPFHDVCSYFGFTYKGIELVLKDCGFTDVKVWPGINAFSLITRSWFKHLLGWQRQTGERLAFRLVRFLFVTLLWLYLFIRKGWNLVKRGELSEDYKNTVEWLACDTPLQYAGHIQFLARKQYLN